MTLLRVSDAQSFGCLRISFILKIAKKLLDVNPLLAFRKFCSASHTGAVIATWKTHALQPWALHPVKSMSLWTEDGASNNVKSCRILKAPWETCAPHQVQRANLMALGIAGATSKNPAGKAHVQKMSRQSSTFHRSGTANSALREAQEKRGVKESKVKSTEEASGAPRHTPPARAPPARAPPPRAPPAHARLLPTRASSRRTRRAGRASFDVRTSRGCSSPI